MGFNNIEYENAHKPWHPRGVFLGILIHSQCVATLIKINHHVSVLCVWSMSSCSFVRGLQISHQSVCIPRLSFYYRRRL